VIAAPEPGLTEREIIRTGRGAAARTPGTPAGDRTVDALSRGDPRRLPAGRLLPDSATAPLRGYEFGLPVLPPRGDETARGCPSTGWSLSLTAAHVLQVATLFEEQAQDEIFGADGEFRAASTVMPVGWRGTTTTARSSSTAPGRTPRAPPTPPTTSARPCAPPRNRVIPPGRSLFVAPRSCGRCSTTGTVYSACGQRLEQHPNGTGHDPGVLQRARPACSTCRSRAQRRIEAARQPDVRRARTELLPRRLAAIMIGTAYAAADEYARILAARRSPWSPTAPAPNSTTTSGTWARPSA